MVLHIVRFQVQNCNAIMLTMGYVISGISKDILNVDYPTQDFGPALSHKSMYDDPWGPWVRALVCCVSGSFKRTKRKGNIWKSFTAADTLCNTCAFPVLSHTPDLCCSSLLCSTVPLYFFQFHKLQKKKIGLQNTNFNI